MNICENEMHETLMYIYDVFNVIMKDCCKLKKKMIEKMKGGGFDRHSFMNGANEKHMNMLNPMYEDIKYCLQTLPTHIPYKTNIYCRKIISLARASTSCFNTYL